MNNIQHKADSPQADAGQPLRVLHIISTMDPRRGGPVSALVGLASAQARAGQRVSVIATYPDSYDPSAEQALHDYGVNIRMVGPCRTSFLWHPQLKSIVRQAVADADVVHIHALWQEIQHHAATACRQLGKPYIMRPCGMLDPWSLTQSKWKKRLYMLWRLKRDLNAAAALHFTADLERDLTAPLRLSAPAIVEPNGVDLSEFAQLPPPGTFRNRYPQLAGRLLVLFMSRLHPKKGLELLIPAFAQCAHDNAMLVIAGPDSEGYQAKLEALVARHGLTNRTIFTGMLRGAERVAALADADLFVLPSYQENFGIVLAESLAAGTPVITTDQVNIHAEITAASVGAVVPVEMQPLADVLHRWLTDANLRESAAAKARPFVQQRYDWNHIAERWKGHYQRLTRAAMACR